jgi:hypothetical protein
MAGHKKKALFETFYVKECMPRKSKILLESSETDYDLKVVSGFHLHVTIYHLVQKDLCTVSKFFITMLTVFMA